MAAPLTLLISCVRLGASFGHWCDRCLVSSRIRVVIGCSINGDPTGVRTFEVCMEGCEPPRWI